MGCSAKTVKVGAPQPKEVGGAKTLVGRKERTGHDLHSTERFRDVQISTRNHTAQSGVRTHTRNRCPQSLLCSTWLKKDVVQLNPRYCR